MRALVSALRSLIFYVLFYIGAIPLIIVAAILLPFSGPFRFLAMAWGKYHRFLAHHVLGIRRVITGTPPPPGVLVAVKHESFYEAIELPHFLPMPVVFAKAELLRIPVWGLAARRYGLVAVHRDQGAKALRAMVAAARAAAATGRPLAIFPEGTRIPHGQQPELQAGFAGLYKLLGLPVVPVAVNSGPLYQRWWKRPGIVTIHYGEVIPPGLPREEIEARVHAAINALNGPAA
jgi:1-acyl-sn-glycerol-3-phosphate acyltransferase